MRRLHVKLALEFPLVVDVDLNEVLATPDVYWLNFVRTCAVADDKAIFVADTGASCAGMGHVRLEGTGARLEMLYVDAALRRQGVAAALVAAQVSWAHALGSTDLVCHIPEAGAGEQLAHHLGWRRTEELFFTKRGLKERRWVVEI